MRRLLGMRAETTTTRRIFSTIIALLVLAALSTALPTAAFGDEAFVSTTTIAEPTTPLIDLANASQQDTWEKITVRGEVVGDIINAGPGHKWLMLQDQGGTVSVLVTNEDAQKITHLGRYNQVGARIEVAGRFKVECDEHDGLTDIHATSIVVLEEGYNVASPFDARKLELGALLIVIGAALFALHWKLRERTR